ncbi:hypothetical protein [Rhodococcus sp. NKCM2511]|uniref:hypothetical protein n=1 Tax=Rhodococcus sp. NKCM2511 TaxID=2766011 RepID=UPI00190FC4D1|nr:hypothetical protein [Rhodococcus sp. NKCM2511]
MPLPSHGRFEYSPIVDRPQFEWPGGARLAVYVAVNCEHFPYDDGPPGLGYTPAMDQPNTYNWGWREYGNRVGGFRIAETLQQCGIRPTLLINTEVYEHARSWPRRSVVCVRKSSRTAERTLCNRTIWTRTPNADRSMR